jgi:hypothetical protein
MTRSRTFDVEISWQFDVADTAFIILCLLAIDTAKGLKFVAPPKEVLAAGKKWGCVIFPFPARNDAPL